MQKYKAKKEVVKQITSELKTLKNENIKPEFAEKLQKSALNSQNEQITSKLQANKNIFCRGDFDEYKIKNLGITEDGCTYNLDNPTERYYYELKKELEKKRADSCNEDIEKAVDTNKCSLEMTTDKNGKIVHRWMKITDEELLKYKQNFTNAVKQFIERGYTQNSMITVLPSIPAILQKYAKMRNDKIVVEPKILRKILPKVNSKKSHNHNMPVSLVNDIPIQLTKPLSILKDKENNHIIIITEQFYKKRPVICAIEVSKNIGNCITVNSLRSFHDKRIENCLTFIDSKEMLYEDKKKMEVLREYLHNKGSVSLKNPSNTILSNSQNMSSNINKSLFTNWKVELHNLCDQKGLDYNSVIQKYDTKIIRFIAEEQLHQDAENAIAYKAYKDLNKSLTYSGYKLQGRTKLYGMDISIENKKGSYRSGVDSDGHNWKTYMNYDYGYIRGTVGTDSDHVDCYIGPDKKATKVYVIHQNNPVTHKYDEDKCMLCFESADAAKKAYMKQYDRPGFFGSMETLTIDQFKSFVFSKQGKRIHKSFDITITDITENNKNEKIEQVQKSLEAIYQNKPFVIKHIPSDNSKRYADIVMRISDFDRSKIEKAVHKMALTLDGEIKSTSKGEAFTYKSQEELTDRIVKEFTQKTNAIYQFVIDYFDLPEIRIVSKSELKYKGRIIYNPETGKPIQEREWKKFVEQLEKFLNRNYAGMGKKIVLSAESLGRILERLSKNNSLDAIKKMKLEDLTYKHRKFDWISSTAQNMKDVFGETVSRDRAARIQVAIDSAAVKVQKVSDSIRNDIQDIIITGVKNKQSKSQVSQNLFDKCVGLNRDFQRIADTEIQNNTNMAYIKEEVYHTEENEKVYFKRFEILDDNTCKQCKNIKGKIVLWSDTALPDEKINDEYADYAIWEGKENGVMPVGVSHCYCRGCWVRYYPDAKY